MLTGGGGLLKNLDKLIMETTDLPVHIAEDPVNSCCTWHWSYFRKPRLLSLSNRLINLAKCSFRVFKVENAKDYVITATILVLAIAISISRNNDGLNVIRQASITIVSF